MSNYYGPITCFVYMRFLLARGGAYFQNKSVGCPTLTAQRHGLSGKGGAKTLKTSAPPEPLQHRKPPTKLNFFTQQHGYPQSAPNSYRLIKLFLFISLIFIVIRQRIPFTTSIGYNELNEPVYIEFSSATMFVVMECTGLST